MAVTVGELNAEDVSAVDGEIVEETRNSDVVGVTLDEEAALVSDVPIEILDDKLGCVDDAAAETVADSVTTDVV